MVTVGQDSRILVWDAATGTVSDEIPPAQGVLPIVVDPDGEWIAAGLSDGGVGIRDAATGDIERTLLTSQDLVGHVEVTPDGALLIASADDGARVWRTDTWEQVVSIPPAPTGTYMAALSPAGDLMATANGDGSIGIFDGNTGHLIRSLDGHRDLTYAVQFDGTGERLLSVGFDRMVRVWDVRTGEELSELLHNLLVSSAEFVGLHGPLGQQVEGVARVALVEQVGSPRERTHRGHGRDRGEHLRTQPGEDRCGGEDPDDVVRRTHGRHSSFGRVVGCRSAYGARGA
jgi:WD40 repeat protein